MVQCELDVLHGMCSYITLTVTSSVEVGFSRFAQYVTKSMEQANAHVVRMQMLFLKWNES